MKYSILIALLSATPALAECPVAADLAGGVRVTESDGTTNEFTLIDDVTVQNDGATTNGYTFRNVLTHGTHLMSLGDTQNGEVLPDTLISTSYPMAPADMPIPQPGTSATYATMVTTNQGTYPETQTQAWGAMTSLTIGDCTYDMIPGKLVYANDTYVVNEGLYYLPALELAILHSYQVKGEPADSYVAVRIEAMQ